MKGGKDMEKPYYPGYGSFPEGPRRVERETRYKAYSPALRQREKAAEQAQRAGNC